MTQRVLGMVTVVVILSSSSACGSPPAIGGPKNFVSERNIYGTASRDYVVVTDVKTGRMTKRLLRNPYKGMRLAGSAVDRDGAVWVTLAAGPSCGKTHECFPEPRSCRGAVLKMEPNGKIRTVLRTASSVLIRGAQPSPDGRRVAYLESLCERSYFNSHIRIDDLGTHRTIKIGHELPPCHSLSNPHWTPDGSRLVVAYGAATVDPKSDTRHLGYTGCSEWRTPGVAVVAATRSQKNINSFVRAADKDCSVADVVATATGFAAIEQCGGKYFLDGPSKVVRYDEKLRVARRTFLINCVNGPQIAVDSSGHDLLISTEGFCLHEEPRVRVFVDRGSGPTVVRLDPEAKFGGSDVEIVSW